MAKAKKKAVRKKRVKKVKKMVPVVGRRPKVTIETDEVKFWFKFKKPDAMALLPLFDALGGIENISEISEDSVTEENVKDMLPALPDMIVGCVTEWEIESPINRDAVDDLGVEIQAQMIEKINAETAKGKN